MEKTTTQQATVTIMEQVVGAVEGAAMQDTIEEVIAAAAAASSSSGRSSSASHFSKDYEKASVGVAEHVFYGVELSNDVLQANYIQMAGLAVIVLLVFLQTQQQQQQRNKQQLQLFSSNPFLAFILGAVLAATPQTTAIPLLTTIIYTRTAYPYMVVIPHCILACATYRTLHNNNNRRKNNNASSYLQSLVCSFFLYGFGGSIVSDVLMGLPATALSHPRIIPCHVLGWTLVHYSPGDWIYQSMRSSSPQKTLFAHLLFAMEAIDAVTTPMGRVSRSARELRNKTTAPVVAGLLAGVGGGSLRFVAKEPNASAKALESAFLKTLSYSILWWYLAVYRCQHGFPAYQDEVEEELKAWNHCDSFNGSDLTRVILVGAHTTWSLLLEFGIVQGHPLVWICKKVFVDFGSRLSSTMRWGPQDDDNIDSDNESDEDFSKKNN